MSIKIAVITAAGLGTRLLPFSKELPKEMVPILVKNGRYWYVKPIVQTIFESLYDVGIRDFCIIVGRGKRAIEDHFTPDRSFLTFLKSKGRDEYIQDLEEFYSKIQNSSIVWVNQPEPKGFGHAVLQARNYVGTRDFIVHAGDTWIWSKRNYLLHLLNEFNEKKGVAGMLLLKKVRDPRPYGNAEVSGSGNSVKVLRVIEKPKIPRSKYAIIPVYVFSSDIFDVLKNTPVDSRGELQLTDAIQGLIDRGGTVLALEMRTGIRIDIGSPQTYLEFITQIRK